MGSQSTNPYAPPTPVSPRENTPLTAAKTLEELGRLPFAGRVTQQELDEYLRADGHVGCARLLMLGAAFGGLLSTLPMLGIPFLAISVGGMGIVAIVLTVSTMPYRRLMFTNANPDWAEQIEGTLQAEGIRLNRLHSSTYYHWNWYGETVISEHVVALIPATQAGAPLLITREMVSNQTAWEALQRVAKLIGNGPGDPNSEEVRRDENLRILKDRKRGWTFSPPDDAIAFEGIVWSHDYALLPTAYRARQRPLRTHLVNYGLTAFAGLLLAGCSGLIFSHLAVLPVLVGVYVLVTIALGRRRRARRGQVIFYLRGYASDESLVTDFGLAVSETKWQGLSGAGNQPDYVVLKRDRINNFIVIRRDMIPDESTWNRFRDMVREKSEATFET
jgi:hypothetical protein